MKFVLPFILIFSVMSCSRFKAERVDSDTSDEKALSITDNWVMRDTETVIKEFLAQMKNHKGYKNYMSRAKNPPALFIADVQNMTSETYFPIADLNAELLNELSATGEFVLVDEEARKRLLGEITYQNDGMVDPASAKKIGKQTGADILIFGSVIMNPESRGGKTIKQYSVNLRMTDLEKGVEIFRTRSKVSKFSEKNKIGW